MFVHLRLHSEFSIVDSTCRIDDVVQAAADDQQPALAITDLSNLFGAIKFYKEARGKGVQPILGAEIFLEGLGVDPHALSRVMVLVQSSGLFEPVGIVGARVDPKHGQEQCRDQAGLAARII